jgi:hypothetical protein
MQSEGAIPVLVGQVDESRPYASAILHSPEADTRAEVHAGPASGETLQVGLLSGEDQVEGERISHHDMPA